MTNFPDSLDTNKTLFNPFNRYKWTSYLKSGIASNATTIILTDLVNLPTQLDGNYIGIDNEIMLVTAVDNTGAEKKLTVTRAQGDSIAAEHITGAEVVQCHTAEMHNKLVEAIIAIQSYILNGITPPSVTLSIDASPYTHAYTSVKGDIYTLCIAVNNSDSSKKAIMNYTVHHYNDESRLPVVIESSMSGDLSDIMFEISNITITGFDIIISGANGGSAKISKTIIGKGV